MTSSCLGKNYKIIVAYNKNWVIGDSSGGIPWHIPEDLKSFKWLTNGGVCVMGRKTWDSIPEEFKPLSNRVNIILSKTHQCMDIRSDMQGVVHLASSLEGALAFSRKLFPEKEVFLIGGGELYKQALEKDLVDRVIASEIKGYEDVDAKTYFPNLNDLGWHKASVKENPEFDLTIWLKDALLLE